MDNKRKIEILEKVKNRIIKRKFGFICNEIGFCMNFNEESYKLIRWFQSTKDSIPSEFKNENWIGADSWWRSNDTLIRAKYLDYLINKLENGNC